MSSVLHRKRIVNTRALHQAAALDRLLEKRGAISLSYPCITTAPPADCVPLDRALHDLAIGNFSWLVFTSGNTVQAVADRLAEADLKVPDSIPIAVVGPSTALAVQEVFGRIPQFMPGCHDAAALAAELPLHAGESVLAPGSDIARPELSQILEDRGAKVTSVVTYRTVTGSGGVDLPDMLERGEVDALTFASPSAVKGLFQRLANEGGSALSVPGIPAVCIGESTRRTAEDFGLSPEASSTQSLEGMVETLERRFFAPVGSGGRMWS